MIGYGNSMFLATHGILARGGGVTPSLLLDTYPNAAVAYSLRKLRTAYTGSAIRVRRSSDNAEQDIGFSGNDLDTTSMLDFVGYNMLNYSEDISNAAYSKALLNTTGTPAYIDVETAPDSTLTGDKIIENTSNGSHQVARASGTRVNGADYNISVYLKQGERTKVLLLSEIAGTQSCEVDLTNGNVSNNTFSTTPTVTSGANGWYRFSVKVTANGTASVSAGIVVRLSNGSTTSYTGDGTSGAYVWGFQLSQTSTVKTYQKTVATGGANGFVTTWYDQSTNANNSTQATAANQAQVVLNGNLRLDPNNNKVSTQWTSDNYTIGTNITIAQNFLMFAVVNRATTNGIIIPLGSLSAVRPFIFRWGSTGNIDSIITTGSVSHAVGDTTIGDYVISALRDSSSVVKAWKNTNALSTGTSTGTAELITRFGLTGATSSTGWFQELIYWNTDLESSRSAIETDINTYYSVY